MSPTDSKTAIAALQDQLAIARSEINNLRQQIKTLTHTNQKELQRIECVLDTWRCKNCEQQASPASSSLTENTGLEQRNMLPNHSGDLFGLHPIGTIYSDFTQKRGVPRQSGICTQIQGKIILNKLVFTNPEHALEGLDGFSHMWILFYFHRNDSNHVKAKVCPPRLNGARTGVFSTRSPHRPCPIGLSLVHINYIDGGTVYFSGVDMLDGTPVLDLKPYIPHYDNPIHLLRTEIDKDLEGQAVELPVVPLNRGEREAPDGEESDQQASSLPTGPHSPPHVVRVPAWITDPPVAQLAVTFSKQAEEHLTQNTKEIIKSVLREDPRSVYLRERYGNQFYTFLIQELHVSCKFDDPLQAVHVYRVSGAGKKCHCGLSEWQCTEHNNE